MQHSAPDIPLRITVAESPRRIGKSLYWCQAGEADGIWRDEGAAGLWRKPTDLGFKSDSNVSKTYNYYRLAGEPTIQFRHALRKDLIQTPNRALIMGDLADSVSLAEARNSWKSILSLPRKQSLFVDSPRAFLTLDCDKLNLHLHDKDIDVVAQDDELPDILADVLDHCGLDWLIADSVMHLSSTHGLLDRQTLKAHIEWRLDEPLTLAQQKSIALYVNKQSTAAGFGDIVDTVIYTPDRLIFTAPAALHQRVWRAGKGIVTEPAAGPHIQRVRLINRGQPVIEVPREALISANIERFTRHIVKLPRSLQPADTKLKPGNVYQALRARIYAAALKTPEHKTNQVLGELAASLQADIEALPDNDAETLARRLRYISPQELRRSWDAAIAKRRPWQPLPDYAAPAAHTPQAARAIVAKACADFVQEAQARTAGRQSINLSEDALITPEPPKPLHLLLRVPPGAGKTYAALAAIPVAHMTAQRVSYLAPTVRLSEEALARKSATLPNDEYIRSRARHHKGRKHLCKSEEYDRLASQLEAIGRSPIKDVCGRCSLRDACAWPAQQADTESGLVAAQHAHATTAMQRVGEDSPAMPAYGIVDESLIGTMLQETQETRHVAALRRATLKSTIRDDEGHVVNSATNDLRAYRDFVLKQLSSSTDKLARSPLLYYAGTLTLTTKDGTRIQRTRLEDARQLEHRARHTYNSIVKSSLSDIHACKAANRPYVKHQRILSAALTQIKLSQWFDDLYRAIGASLSTKREHIFGVTLHRGKVTIQIRAQLPTPLNARSWLWLDGTANTDVWQASLAESNADLRILDVRVQPGAYHLTQYPDRPYGKGMFNDAASPKSNLQRLRRYIHWLAAKHRGKDPHADVLVICQKPVETALLAQGLPANVKTEHFNNLRGLDVYRSTPCAVIVGRPMPTAKALETATEALYYDDPGVINIAAAPSLSRGRRILDTAYGTAMSVPCEVHADPRVEAVRQQMADAEVKQAVHRLRVYDRTQHNPAEIHVFGQADTGLPVHVFADWIDAEREAAEVIQQSGVLAVSEDVLKCQSGSLLAGASTRTIRRVVEHNTKLCHDPIEEYNRAGREEGSLLSVMAQFRNVDAMDGGVTGCNGPRLGHGLDGAGSLSHGWVCWSVRFAERAGKFASRVWVDGRRHADVQAAIERETGLRVLQVQRYFGRDEAGNARRASCAPRVAAPLSKTAVAPLGARLAGHR